MIKEQNGVFLLNTANTLYALRVRETGHLEHLYYGRSFEMGDDVSPFAVKHIHSGGYAVSYDREHNNLSMNEISLEVAGRGTGDMRSPSVELVWEDGSSTVDMVYESFEILKGKPELATMPTSYGDEGEVSTLKITMKEKYRRVKLELYYSVFPACDVITRSCILRNEGEESVMIKKLMSAQLDIPGSDYVMTSFHGGWANEMGRVDTVVTAGGAVNASRTGFSSSHANPFVMLFAPGSTEDFGEGYACNLIYSGVHMETAEVNNLKQTRFQAGINPEFFSWKLAAGEAFETPEAVLTYSDGGYSRISEHMHSFVREHVVRGEWKKKERPVLLNSWEASYFDITEESLLQLARAGKEVGIELFVMDDGWFGERNNDDRSLGDWVVNEKKLPGGIKGLADKINELGMMFGIWVEPEMVNENSDLYRSHPDWAVKIPGRNHSEGRNQMLLDLTRKEVQEYIIDSMVKVFSSGNIAYVKWDMNRQFSDLYSGALAPEKQGEFLHRYMMGLYRVLGELMKRFPHILFESCAGGGNRFDLGMLCFMPQIWTSDNTDAICRCYIQNGASYGYPQSVMGSHVSACPNHQTSRITPLETRFAVAAMGVLGYECNLSYMSEEELAMIKDQIALYKAWRKTIQYGQFYRIGGKLNGMSGRIGMQDSTNLIEWNIVSEDREKAVVSMVQELVKMDMSQLTLRTKGLAEDTMYHFTVDKTASRYIESEGEKEDYLVSGGLLNHAGIALSQSNSGPGAKNGCRVYQDFGSRMYLIEKA